MHQNAPSSAQKSKKILPPLGAGGVSFVAPSALGLQPQTTNPGYVPVGGGKSAGPIKIRLLRPWSVLSNTAVSDNRRLQ